MPKQAIAPAFPLSPEHALHIHEIRRHVSHYVSVNNAISCAQVSKDWSNDFVFRIWHEVDFKVHTTFEKLGVETISKHGHHLRKIKNLKTQSQLELLLHPSINRVQYLTLRWPPTERFLTLSMDFIRNNNSELKEFTVELETSINPKFRLSRMISIDALVPHTSVSKLTNIRFRGICTSRASFSALLKGCPFLTFVDLQLGVSLFSSPCIESFQHARVVELVAPIIQVFKPDPDSDPPQLGSSLLAHFPNLTCWHPYNLETSLIVPLERIKEEVIMCCPKLNQVDTWRTPRPILYGLLANAFRSLRSITFAYSELAENIIIALLLHKETLFSISAFSDDDSDTVERDEYLHEEDHFQASARTLQLLPRCCPKLKVFEFERHIMDMDRVEESDWICDGIEEIRTRIRGLDTKEKIDRALQLWVDGRKVKNKMNITAGDKKSIQEEVVVDTSIESRVAKHLLKFDNLSSVWLGTRTRLI